MFTPLNGQYQPKHKPRIFARKSCPVAIDVMDLDSTLTSSAAEEALEQALVDEMAQYFPDKTREEAIAINQAGYRKHGTTALFIEHEFGVPQDEFVRAAYTRFHENCGDMYQPNEALIRALRHHDRPLLSRKQDEKIIIGDSITLMVVSIQGDKVRLGIEAPKEVTIHREEVYQAIQQERQRQSQDA